jgi:hypothetical protein
MFGVFAENVAQKIDPQNPSVNFKENRLEEESVDENRECDGEIENIHFNWNPE